MGSQSHEMFDARREQREPTLQSFDLLLDADAFGSRFL